MSDSIPPFQPFDTSPQELALDPDLLAMELAQELLGDPLDDVDLLAEELIDVAAECDHGLKLLAGSAEERIQGLRIFCEHRDPRAIPALMPCWTAPVRFSE